MSATPTPPNPDMTDTVTNSADVAGPPQKRRRIAVPVPATERAWRTAAQSLVNATNLLNERCQNEQKLVELRIKKDKEYVEVCNEAERNNKVAPPKKEYIVRVPSREVRESNEAACAAMCKALELFYDEAKKNKHDWIDSLEPSEKRVRKPVEPKTVVQAATAGDDDNAEDVPVQSVYTADTDNSVSTVNGIDMTHVGIQPAEVQPAEGPPDNSGIVDMGGPESFFQVEEYPQPHAMTPPPMEPHEVLTAWAESCSGARHLT